MTGQNLGEPFDRQVIRRHREVAPDAWARAGRDERRRGVVPLQNKFPAKQLVPAAIRRANKLMEDFEMGLAHPDRAP